MGQETKEKKLETRNTQAGKQGRNFDAGQKKLANVFANKLYKLL